MNAPAPHPRRVAMDILRDEHRALGDVIDLLQRLLRDAAAGYGEPDFQLLSLALYYIEDFQCKVHHPREDRHLFAAVRRCTSELDREIAQLAAEHRSDAGMVRELCRLLVHYQAGAPDALSHLRTSLDVYAGIMLDHMSREESLMDDPRVALPDEAWRAIASAFLAEADPLFRERRREFDMLHHRIVNLLPRKMRHPRG